MFFWSPTAPWQVKSMDDEEEIPPALQKKWQDMEKHGLKAGVCPSCGWPFTQDELTCRHCEKAVEVHEPILASTAHWLFKTPWGIITLVILLLSVIASCKISIP
jgi:predicted amidophosphoribosyltransferase